MNAPARLGLYAFFLAIVFGVAAVAAGAIVPQSTVDAWTRDVDANSHGGHDDNDAPDRPAAGDALGLGLASGDYRLSAVAAPHRASVGGELSLVVTGPDGRPVTAFQPEHEKELHLIVVRSDGQQFRHVHPERAADGTWSLPWSWDEAGTYRVYADFTPAASGKNLTLSSTLHVEGDYRPVPARPTRSVSVDGYDVAVQGDLVAGGDSTLTMRVTRGGRPVTALQPYLGAFGHLVALREGDLAYLHVHPHGDEPKAGETSGPEIAFTASAPTPGRYLLYLDFRVGGRVRTAPLVLDATGPASTNGAGAAEHTSDEGDDDGHDD